MDGMEERYKKLISIRTIFGIHEIITYFLSIILIFVIISGAFSVLIHETDYVLFYYIFFYISTLVFFAFLPFVVGHLFLKRIRNIGFWNELETTPAYLQIRNKVLIKIITNAIISAAITLLITIFMFFSIPNITEVKTTPPELRNFEFEILKKDTGECTCDEDENYYPPSTDTGTSVKTAGTILTLVNIPICLLSCFIFFQKIKSGNPSDIEVGSTTYYFLPVSLILRTLFVVFCILSFPLLFVTTAGMYILAEIGFLVLCILLGLFWMALIRFRLQTLN